MMHLKEVIITFVTILLISSNVNAAPTYGASIEGEILYATVLKTGDSYSISSISPNEGNVRINDLSPNFSTARRNCGIYVAINGNPANAEAAKCEEQKAFQFITTKVNKVENLILTVFSAGINVVAGGRHTRSGYFDEDEYRKAIDEAFVKANIDREMIIYNYTYFKNKDKELLELYNTQRNKIKINIQVKDETGFFRSQNLSEYVASHISTRSLTEINKQSYSEFAKFIERQAIDILLAEKYNDFEFGGYNGTVSGYQVELEPSNARSGNNSIITVKANITNKMFSSIYPQYDNQDKNIKIQFKGNKLQFENKTSNYLQVLSISMYYGPYVKTILRNDNPLELAPEASTIDPIDVTLFEDNKMVNLSTYEKVTASSAKKTNINFGFAVKYRVVEQNQDKTLFKTLRYNLYEMLVSKI